MERFITLACLFIVFAIGFLNLLSKLKKIRKKVDFANEFIENLFQYVGSHGRDGEAYTWLIHRSSKMQSQMGSMGRLASFSPPYSRVRYENYEIIVNLLPSLRQSFVDRISVSDTLSDSYAATIHESILRYIGILDDNSESISEKIRNPFIWFTTGVSILFILPVQILSWFGIIGKSVLIFLTSSYIFRLIVGISSLIGFFSAIVGLVTGWDQFMALMKPIVSKII
ncbi:hypothetical protein GTP44_11800 [Duganella sp. FT50W]|uniref:Uncharacterized protein n=1 Tax=Duganella lactea TaxID=2692173 RepID=A0A6L8MHU5_9BURK|nr:hypothetical protein [Duganella lactea]MYM82637.1 hypothetical protein [Duganella lactea]